MSEQPPIDILVVDDNPDNLIALEAILSEPGRRVVRAASGRAALKHLLLRDFAVILLDVNMPIMDGFETALLIRQRVRSEHTPIIFVTALADDTHVARGYSIGAADYILTPVVPEILRAKVAVFAELFRKTEEVRRQSESLRHRADQLHALSEASLAINSTPSIDGILETVTTRARAMIGTHASVATARLEPAPARHGVALSDECGRVCHDHPSVVAALASSLGRCTALTRIRRGERTETTLPDLLDGWIAAPLRARDDRVLGSLIVAGRIDDDFTAEDEALLVQLAQITTIAIENVLYSQEREANRLKDEFLATVSHELRTPLSAMLSWARLMRSNNGDATTVTRGLEVIERNAKAQARLIEDLLDMSRIVTGKLQLETAPVDLAAIINDALESVMPSAETKGLVLKARTGSVSSPVIGDAKRLQQVLWNLLTNAVKFSPNGGSIETTLAVVDGCAQISVRDNGPGIAPAFLPHVFERFRQADTSITRSHGGIGVGLTIVRHLVELHGGQVRAESDGDGKGATFVVRLPLAEPEERIVGLHAGVAAVPAVDATPVTAGPPQALAGIRILVVEDDDDGREAIARILMVAGASVVAVASAGQALQTLADSASDILVSDIGLPFEDGYALIKKVRALDPDHGGSIPAVALTAYTRTQDRLAALGAGYQAHIGKPVDPTELLAALTPYAQMVIARRTGQSPAAHRTTVSP